MRSGTVRKLDKKDGWVLPLSGFPGWSLSGSDAPSVDPMLRYKLGHPLNNLLYTQNDLFLEHKGGVCFGWVGAPWEQAPLDLC